MEKGVGKKMENGVENEVKKGVGKKVAGKKV